MELKDVKMSRKFNVFSGHDFDFLAIIIDNKSNLYPYFSV